MRRKTGSGTVEITDDGGVTYTDITSSINSSTYTQLTITTTQANPSIGFRLGTSGDEIEADFVTTEDGSEATYPSETTSSTVTRDNDQFDISEFSTWFNADEGIALFAMTETGDWATIDATWPLYGGSTTRLVYRNNALDGVSGFDGASATTATAGHTPGSEVLIATIWSVALNAFVIGYTSNGGTTWTWDVSPATFSGFSPAADLSVFELLVEFCRARGLAIYGGLPPGSDSSITDVETWCEDNIVGVIDGLKKS